MLAEMKAESEDLAMQWRLLRATFAVAQWSQSLVMYRSNQTVESGLYSQTPGLQLACGGFALGVGIFNVWLEIGRSVYSLCSATGVSASSSEKPSPTTRLPRPTTP